MPPGYTGVITPETRQVLTLKTTVSQRLPLADRATQARSASQTPNPTASAAQSAAHSYFLPKRHTGYTTYTEASKAYVRSASDVPKRATERGVDAAPQAVSTVPFEGTTTNRDSTLGYCLPEDPHFYSHVRVVERTDDDARHSLEDPKTRSGAAKNLRCSSIQTKRETDPIFAPEPMKFIPVPRVRPNNMVSAQGGATQPLRSASAFSGSTTGSTTSVSSFASAPVARAVFTAGGSTQSLDFPDPRSQSQKATDVYADKRGTTLLASDRALVGCATSRDLFAGTAKASEDVASGYMGHVPANAGNVARVRGAADQLRAHMKTVDTVTAPTSNSTTSLLRQKFAIARAEAEAQSGRPATPKTSAAFYQSQAAASKDERKINRVECGRKNAVRGFFSRGEGEQDDLVADQFCVRYRPLEGVMRHGPPNQHSWISDVELRRSPRL